MEHFHWDNSSLRMSRCWLWLESVITPRLVHGSPRLVSKPFMPGKKFCQQVTGANWERKKNKLLSQSCVCVCLCICSQRTNRQHKNIVRCNEVTLRSDSPPCVAILQTHAHMVCPSPSASINKLLSDTMKAVGEGGRGNGTNREDSEETERRRDGGNNCGRKDDRCAMNGDKERPPLSLPLSPPFVMWRRHEYANRAFVCHRDGGGGGGGTTAWAVAAVEVEKMENTKKKKKKKSRWGPSASMDVSPSPKHLFDWIVAGEDHSGCEQGRTQRDSVETARSKALDSAREEDHRFLSPRIRDPEKSRDLQELRFAARTKKSLLFSPCFHHWTSALCDVTWGADPSTEGRGLASWGPSPSTQQKTNHQSISAAARSFPNETTDFRSAMSQSDLILARKDFISCFSEKIEKEKDFAPSAALINVSPALPDEFARLPFLPLLFLDSPPPCQIRIPWRPELDFY